MPHEGVACLIAGSVVAQEADFAENPSTMSGDDAMDEEAKPKRTIEEVEAGLQARYIARGGTCYHFWCSTPGRPEEWAVNCTTCGAAATVTCATACLCQGARDFRAWCQECDDWVTCRPA